MNNKMKRVIIGDVHGCTDELCALLDKLDLCAGDWVCFAGDVIDKGPDAVGTVARIMALRNQGVTVELVLGNHEWKFLRYMAGRKVRVCDEFIPLKDHCENDTTMHEFLLDAKLYVSMFNRDRPRFPGIVVHAGFPPDLKALPRAFTAREMLVMKPRDLRGANRVTFCRYVNPDGHAVQLGSETDNDVYWASTYNARFKHAFFGHQPFMPDVDKPWPTIIEAKQFPNATGLDLGCVFGGYLCAAVIDMYNTVSFVTVKAQQKYAAHYREEQPEQAARFPTI